MTDSDYILTLVRETLHDLDLPVSRLTAVMRKAVRIARLRSDWEAVYWLSMELEPLSDKEARTRRIGEAAPFFSRDELRKLHTRSLEELIASRMIGHIGYNREIDEEKMTSLSVPELEEIVASAAAVCREPLPSNLNPVDTALLSERRRASDDRAAFSLTEIRKVLARLAQRTHTFLSRVERQLALGQQQADFFEHNRLYVENKLGLLSPEALDQLRTALKRASEGTAEGRSHSLTSCRRALKSVADRLYPARTNPIRGNDGKERTLDDSKFVSRLWQYLAESSAGSASKKLLQGEIDHLGPTIDRLNELSSKGVHDQVTAFEVNACVISMYSLVGALLRLHEQDSAATLDPSQLRPR
jgi:hypothetical protein